MCFDKTNAGHLCGRFSSAKRQNEGRPVSSELQRKIVPNT